MNTSIPRNYPLILLVEGDLVGIIGLTLRPSAHRKTARPVLIAQEREEALAWIARSEPRETKTVAVLQALNMPRANDLMILKMPEDHPEWGNIQAMIFATSMEGRDINKAYGLNFNSNAVKPQIAIMLWKSRNKPNCNGAFIMNFKYK